MREPLWTIDELVAACGGRLEGSAAGSTPVSSVSIDTRTLEPGALYVAIRGENHDGHDYIGKAFEAGAAVALAADDADVAATGPVIRVPETLRGLENIGKAARARSGASVIAVTGSVGKTGTKEALRLALEPSGSVHASAKSYNNHWGVPLTLANLPRDARFGVFEIGMNHPGEIIPLTRMVRPHVAIVTTVEPVHLEFFESVAQIAEAKAEIFAGLEDGGIAILNHDNPHFDLLKQRAQAAGAARIIPFGTRPDADARLVESSEDADGSQFEASICGDRIYCRIGAPGRHLVMNALAVLAAAWTVGADMAAATDALAFYRAPQGRGRRETLDFPGGGKLLLIDESYNANPASMGAAIAALGTTPRKEFPRRIAVLGDMLELGATSPQLHAGLAEPVDAAGVDVVFACGPNMQSLYDALPGHRRGSYAKTSDGLREAVVEAVAAGDAVMIKGSLGSRMGLLVEALRERLSQ